MIISEHKIKIDNTVIYYKKWEQPHANQTLILLHDSLGCTVLWREWPEELAESLGCNVISYDRRGYGLSDHYNIKRPISYLEQEAEILGILLNEWKVEKPILFGFSDGASVATLYAGMYAENISLLIIEGVHVLLEEQTLQGVRDAEVALETTKIAKALEKYHGDKVFELYQAWTKTWLSEAHQTWNIEYIIPKIVVPTLVIQGEFDEFGSMKQVDAFDNSGGYVEKLIVKNVKHTAHKENKTLVFEQIIDFINQNI